MTSSQFNETTRCFMLAFHRAEGKTDRNDLCRKAITDLGYVELGRGMYATVYKCPWDDTKAIKLGWSGASDGWLQYASYIVANKPKNSLFPTIHEITYCDGVFIALIERYKCEASSLHEHYDVDKEAKTIAYNISRERPRHIVNYQEDDTPRMLKMRLDVAQWMNELDRADISYTDMHGGNIMMSYDNQVKITDPCASASSHRTMDLLRQTNSIKDRTDFGLEPKNGPNKEMNKEHGSLEAIQNAAAGIRAHYQGSLKIIGARRNVGKVQRFYDDVHAFFLKADQDNIRRDKHYGIPPVKAWLADFDKVRVMQDEVIAAAFAPPVFKAEKAPSVHYEVPEKQMLNIDMEQLELRHIIARDRMLQMMAGVRGAI